MQNDSPESHPSKSRWTTAVSDAILASTALWAARHLHRSSSNWHLHVQEFTTRLEDTPVFGILGFLLISIAACCGILRFGMSNPPPKLVRLHEKASAFAGIVSTTCFSVHCNFQYRMAAAGWLHFVAMAVVIVSCPVVPKHLGIFLTALQQVSAVGSVITVTVLKKNWKGALGSELFILAWLAIGTEGKVFGLPAVDTFHYTLACALYLLAHAMAIEAE